MLPESVRFHPLHPLLICACRKGKGMKLGLFLRLFLRKAWACLGAETTVFVQLVATLEGPSS